MFGSGSKKIPLPPVSVNCCGSYKKSGSYKKKWVYYKKFEMQNSNLFLNNLASGKN